MAKRVMNLEMVASHPTQLIGREGEIMTVRTYLKKTSTRLLTLTGPGGIGKTSLAQHVVTEIEDVFANGIYFASLALISDPELVIPTIAQTFEIKDVGEMRGLTILELLISFLKDKQLLLVLDNFEQVISAAPKLATLLSSCPTLKMLVTSRAALHIEGELEFHVHPLATPDPEQLPEWEKLMDYAAVEFFLQRVQSRNSGFMLNSTNARSIAEICSYLNGNPMAIKLATTYINVLSPQALLQRLKKDPLETLKGDSRDVPIRQQSLSNTLLWSYQLLEPRERQLFRHLSVFIGGCTLDALEKISVMLGDEAGHILVGVASLIDKSLLQRDEREEESYFMMLQTIREYGLDRLKQEKEEEETRRAHALYYFEFVQIAALKLRSSEQEQWFEHLERDYENLRAALDWLLSDGEIEKAQQMTSALSWFWIARGNMSEGLQWLEKVLSRCKEGMVSIRAEMLSSVGMVALMRGDITKAESFFTLTQKAGNTQDVALSFQGRATVAWLKNDAVEARMLVEQALELWKQLDEREGIAWSLSLLGLITAYQDDYTRAFALTKEGLELFRACGDAVGIAYGLLRMAEVVFLRDSSGEKKRARDKSMREVDRDAESLTLIDRKSIQKENNVKVMDLVQESLDISKRLGNRWGISQAFALSGKIVAARDDKDEAYDFYKKALEVVLQTLNKSGIASYVDIASCLEALATIKFSQEYPRIAALFWGAAEAVRKSIGLPLPDESLIHYNNAVASARYQLGNELFADAWAEGRTMQPEHLFDILLLHEAQLEQKAQSKRVVYPDGLTSREVEVLRLLARGLSDRQVANELTIEPRTVNTHLTRIYQKIRVDNRSAATRYVLEHGLDDSSSYKP